jgi:LEA14-like dessication related protein
MPGARTRSVAPLLILVLAAAASSSCAGLGRIFEKPKVHILSYDVTHVSLESADLVFAVSVENPNALSFVLDTVGYRLWVNGEQLLDGRSDLQAAIAARSASEVRFPVRLRFSDVLRVLRAVKEERHAGYELEADFRFDVPVVGHLQVPVRKQGDFSLGDVGAIGGIRLHV